MKNIKIIAITVLLLSASIHFPAYASAEKKPWEKTAIGKVVTIDEKYNLITIEVKKEKKFLIFKRVDIVQMPIRILTSANRTEILVNDIPGIIKDIKIDDIVKIDYNAEPMGAIAQKIKILR